MDLKNKKVVVIGSGKSGQAVAQFVRRLGGIPRISEQQPLSAMSGEFQTWIRDEKIQTEFGGHTEKFIGENDLIVLSPGVRFDALPAQWARAKKIPVVGEIELA